MIKNWILAFLATFWLITILVPISLNAATLHAFLVGDSLDDSIGPSTLSDLYQMSKQVKVIAGNTDMELNLSILKAEQVTVEEVVNRIHYAQIEADDVVLLYFSCHGFRIKDKKDRWPYLFFNPKNEALDFHEITQMTLQKQPRLLISLADCCNTFVKDEIFQKNAFNLEKAIKLNKSKENYKKLFRECSGSIIISSSIPGQSSLCDSSGGVYTQFFLKKLNSTVRGAQNPTWNTLLSAVSDNVESLYRNGNIDTPQSPQYELQIKELGQ